MGSYQETLKYMFNLRGGDIDLRLHRVQRILSILAHPEQSYPSFHIAGTNGKGSTAAMLHRILSAQGYRVGLYTSPHVVSFTERIRVGQEEISEREVVELADRVKTQSEEAGISLTFFEFVTVVALLYFAERTIDVAVIEVGLGGRLDATNLIVPKVAIITTISKDHEAYLGSDLLSIAREKGGIIKEGVPLVCGSLAENVRELLSEMARAKGGAEYLLGRDFSYNLRGVGLFDYIGIKWRFSNVRLGLRGRHQRSNAAIALAALEVTGEDFPVSEKAVREGLETVFWPGRFEVVLRRPTVILDGAHNGEGINALVNEIRDFRGGEKVKLLFASMRDKDWLSMLRELSTVASEVVLTRVSMERSADPWKIREAVGEKMPAAVIEDPSDALRFLLERSSPDASILVTGSLYLLGEVRPLLVEMAARESHEREFADSRQ